MCERNFGTMKNPLHVTLRNISSWGKIEQPFHMILIDNKQVNSWEINVSLNSMDVTLTHTRTEVTMYLTKYHKVTEVTDGL